MTFDDAVTWLNDRRGQSVAIWISVDDGQPLLSTEGELGHPRDASGALMPPEESAGIYDLSGEPHVRVVLQEDNVVVIDYGGESVRVFMTADPRIAIWPNDSHLLVQIEEGMVLHIVEQDDQAATLAGVPVPADAVDDLAALVRATGADELADRLDRAVADEVKLLALTLDERAIMLSSLEDPPKALSELRAVLLADHQWRRGAGLD